METRKPNPAFKSFFGDTMKRYKKQKDQTTNSSVYKKLSYRCELFDCGVCPPNKGCNSKRGKRTKAKPKYKDKR